MSEIQRCVWCDRPKATVGDWDRLDGGEGDGLCWEPMRCESAGSESVVAALRAEVEQLTKERDEALISRDEWRRLAEEQLADVLRLRFLGIEFASQYGDRALACKYDNSCDDSGREPACIPCAFRFALGLMGVN